MVINTTLGVILTILFYLVLPTIVLCTIKSKKVIFILSTILMVLFVVVLYFLTLGDVSISREYVTIGLDFSGEWCNKEIHFTLTYGGIRDVVINACMLLPIGAYIVITCDTFDKKHVLLKSLLVGFVVGLSIETLQFVLPIFREVQLRDVLLNSLSAFLGAIVYIGLYKLRKKLLKLD